MKFSDYNISADIKKQLVVLGFNRPTDIQFKAIKPILDGEDVMAIAQTGTGKTAAFAIPTIDMVSRAKAKYSKGKGVKCLVLVPTRELAKQIAGVYHDLAKYTKVKTFGLYGGVEQEQQIATLNNGIDILIATPGRMFDLISQGALDVTSVKQLVLDEADLMLDLGFAKDITDVLKFVPQKRQTLFFSATISRKIKSLAYDVVKNPIRIQISPKNPVAKTISHAIVMVEMDDKRFFLENMAKEYPDYKMVVFVRTKVRAERVVAAMERVQISSEALHGGIEQKDRFAILDNFRDGDNKILITTDVAARGIDIPNVDMVINYDIPDVSENYVHRCGRTGRGNKRGQALSFCSPDEVVLLEEIEKYTGDTIDRYEMDKTEYLTIVKDTQDGSYNWKALIDEANKEDGSGDEW
ncbi:MAG: DEAD/DEAH box helicase [Crocinitomicaceae bacterium]|nr:DEAD/DEAH box helicase [Flavobacteriales bacterium]NQZ37530.1 DEAD/DEAH box helicase [Crocinitomicaceae bacterium]